MNDRISSYFPEQKEIEPVYEITKDFNNVEAVGAIVLDPEEERILLVRRVEEEYDKNGEVIEIPKPLRNRVDSPDKIFPALPSGSGPLNKECKGKPDEAIVKEIISETGTSPTFLRKFYSYKRVDVPNSKKVGFYVAKINPDLLNLSNPYKNWPGFFPLEWVGTKIVLPYAEHNRVVLDFLKERSAQFLK